MEEGSLINIKKHTLKSRFFLAPINTGLALKGNPTKDLISFHELRSNQYTGINYVGNVAIDTEKVTNANTLFINSSMENYKKLASAIEKKGSIAGVQIACFKSKYETLRTWKNKNPDSYIDLIKSEMSSLKYTELKVIIQSFQASIIKLYNLGFRAIQLHGAHGYFLNNFLSETFNNRSDEFGKDRTLIIKEILNGIRQISTDCIIDLRISLFENKIEHKLDTKHIDFLNTISNIHGLDIVSISNGVYNIDKQLIYPLKNAGEVFMLNILSDYLKTKPGILWNISGNVRNLNRLKNEEANITFAIGRPLIADPGFIKKQLENHMSEIVECEYKNKCHYFSRSKGFIECGVNKKVF